MKTKKSILLLVTTLLLYYCSAQISVDEPTFDKRLIGTWGTTTPDGQLVKFSPEHSFLGYSFSESQMKRLGVDYTTGKIKELDYCSNYKLRYSSKDSFSVYFTNCPGNIISAFKYYFEDDRLIIKNGSSETILEKLKPDSIYFPKQNAYSKFKINGKEHQTSTVSNFLNVYGKRQNRDSLIIRIHAQHADIKIQISGFSGPGVYKTPYIKAETTINPFYTYDELLVGYIKIFGVHGKPNLYSGFFSLTFDSLEEQQPGYLDIRFGYLKMKVFD